MNDKGVTSIAILKNNNFAVLGQGDPSAVYSTCQVALLGL
jgi:hypothetical protein